MRKVVKLACLCVVFLVAQGCGSGPSTESKSPAPAPVPVEQSTATGELAQGFQALYEPYAVITATLADDRTDGVAEQAHRLSEAGGTLLEDLSADAAGVAETDVEALRELLVDLIAAAEGLTADELEDVRVAFGPLSQQMIEYRDLLEGTAPLVAYCPMAKASWLQSDVEISNPYYGSEMLRCGEIVRR